VCLLCPRVGAILTPHQSLRWKAIVVNIRAATIDDLPGLAALWQERQIILARADPRFDRGRPDPAAWMERVAADLCRPDAVIYLAEKDEPAGYIAGHLHPADGDPRCGVVDEMALDAHTYHAGLGRELWRALWAWFAARGAVQTIIRVPRYSPVEQAFWRALGAVEWKPEQTNILWSSRPELMWMTL
jgi:GNAT superfamily N-acetyltransferase